MSDVQDYFEYVLKKHGENTAKPSVQIYVNKIENSFTFKIKNGYRTFNVRDNEITWKKRK